MKILNFLIVSAILIASASCSKKGVPLTANEIEELYGNGVVLIKNEYYYTVDVEGAVFYFTGIDSEGDLENLAFDTDDFEPAISFGTGFFVSEDGKICTNHHVVGSEVDTHKVEANMREVLKTVYDYMLLETEEEINSYHDIYMKAPVGSYEENAAKSKRDEARNTYLELKEAKADFMSVNTSNYKIDYHSSVGIAYNNTFITNTSDFSDCVVVKLDKDHDLAIIQLKSKKAPMGTSIFNICEPSEKHQFLDINGEVINDHKGEPLDLDDIKIGSRLFMIGYNRGPALAITEEGVKAQITSGEISQKTNNETMMYTIPALQGSSGSPVLDEYGNLVGINFAGLSTTQSFNYGVKVKYLRELLED